RWWKQPRNTATPRIQSRGLTGLSEDSYRRGCQCCNSRCNIWPTIPKENIEVLTAVTRKYGKPG
ncbi:MAG: hypothetical protein KAT75_11880, partial [Dehalococcoidia bacterium]|nr:hypothetical protein [Dehalococcoidia bacterium]